MNVNSTRGITLLLAFVGAFSAAGLLLIAGWFVCATAVAGVTVTTTAFNYLLPSVAIRLFAFTKITCTYGEKYFGHDLLLTRLNTLRKYVFIQSQNNSTSPPRGEDMEKLEKATNVIASSDIAYRIPVITLTLITLLLCALIFAVLPEYILLVGVLVTCLIIILVIQRIRLRRAYFSLRESETEYRTALESRLNSASIWSLTTTNPVASKQERWNKRTYSLFNTETSGEIAIQALTSAAIVVFLFFIPKHYLGTAVIALIPFAILLLNELFNIGVRAQKDASALDFSQQALKCHTSAAIHVQDSPTATQESVQHLSLTEFCWKRTHTKGIPVTASFSRGDCVHVIGESGTGKSSFFLAMTGLIPSSGALAINNKNAGALRTHFLYYSEQSPTILSATLRHNLLIANPNASEELLTTALHHACLSHFETKLDRWLGPQGILLSGGERKRMGIARAIISQKPVWLLDEPFEALDADVRHNVIGNMNQYYSKKILFIATHITTKELTFGKSISLSK